MGNSYYDIKVRVREIGLDDEFYLFNEASGAPAGDRLYKGPEGWPFSRNTERWYAYKTLSSAQEAATMLQFYLDNRHKSLGSK